MMVYNGVISEWTCRDACFTVRINDRTFGKNFHLEKVVQVAIRKYRPRMQVEVV